MHYQPLGFLHLQTTTKVNTLVNTEDSGFKPENLLSDANINRLKSEISKVQRQDRKLALKQLIQHGKVMSIDDDDVLRGLVNANVLSKPANVILKNAHKSVRHTCKKNKCI